MEGTDARHRTTMSPQPISLLISLLIRQTKQWPCYAQYSVAKVIGWLTKRHYQPSSVLLLFTTEAEKPKYLLSHFPLSPGVAM